MSNIKGLTFTELKTFGDCLIKANNGQLKAMFNLVYTELKKREVL